MVCKVHVAMQGRIDATRLFGERLWQLLKKADWIRSLWDPQLGIYHKGPCKDSSASLGEVLRAIKGAGDTEPQQPPIGYALAGWHVDDALSLACDVKWELDFKLNRVAQFLKGTIEVVYATTMTGWHGNKSLGFTLTLSEADETVNMSAPGTLKQLCDDMLKDAVRVTPKHIMSADFFNLPSGEMPDKSDPEHASVTARMATDRHALGALIWLSEAYVEAKTPTNALCSNMAMPGFETHKRIMYQLMYMEKNSAGITFGGKHWGPMNDLQRPDDDDELIAPFTDGKKAMYYHFFSDANLLERGTCGGVGMLAGGPIQTYSQRLQLANPCSHSAEVVAAGNNLSQVVPVNGLLQEIRIRCGSATPFYLDSKTTVFVATSDTAVKKSVWLLRRVAVLTDNVNHGEITPIHINDPEMIADPFTKYIVVAVWSKHMLYVLNNKGFIEVWARG